LFGQALEEGFGKGVARVEGNVRGYLLEEAFGEREKARDLRAYLAESSQLTVTSVQTQVPQGLVGDGLNAGHVVVLEDAVDGNTETGGDAVLELEQVGEKLADVRVEGHQELAQLSGAPRGEVSPRGAGIEGQG